MSDDAVQVAGTGHSSPTTPPSPGVAAAFLVKFDDRKGYTLAWQQSVDALDVEGVVEFKSMPSGLHNVKEDLVYFVHEDYAGISAVLNIEDESAARKARIIAVGVLIPLEHGRMGKSWLYAESLKELTEKQIQQGDDYTALEEFWEEHKISVTSTTPIQAHNDSNTKGSANDTDSSSQPLGYRTNRAMSIGTLHPAVDYSLPEHHPALVVPEMLSLFGPLVFPLVRAALLRKRILFLGESPVEMTCNYVYNLSVLSSLPRPIATIVPKLDPNNIRLRPLLNIGISDIALLESEKGSSGGWIACTTDDVLCTKPDLFDILVVLPGAMSQISNTRPYPKMYLSTPDLSKARPKEGVRATQRDAKRFATLWKGLQSIPRSIRQSKSMTNSIAVASSSEGSLNIQGLDDSDETLSIASTASTTVTLKSVVEPQSWSRIAYTGLVWWASAGDKRGGLSELEENENEQDIALLAGRDLGEDDGSVDDEAKTREVACVQYFQRLSNLIFTAAREAVFRSDGYDQRYTDEEQEQNTQGHDDQNEEEQHRAPLLSQSNEDEQVTEITQEDIQSMGLDVWSVSDRQFIEELVKFWFNRKANVQGGRIECCGVRIL